MTELTYACFIFLTVICVGALTIWLKVARNWAEKSQRSERSDFWMPILLILAWLVTTAFLANAGFFSDFTARPPRVIFVPIIGLIGIVLFNRTAQMRRLLSATPRAWPVAMQSFRIGVELTLWLSYRAGLAPIQTSFEGRNFDVIVGLTAPMVALLVAKRNLNPKIVIAWNIGSLLILGNTLVTVLTSVPGPLHLNWPGEPFTAFATWPIIWLPGFLAPFAVALHVFSIRQNLA